MSPSLWNPIEARGGSCHRSTGAQSPSVFSLPLRRVNSGSELRLVDSVAFIPSFYRAHAASFGGNFVIVPKLCNFHRMHFYILDFFDTFFLKLLQENS